MEPVSEELSPANNIAMTSRLNRPNRDIGGLDLPSNIRESFHATTDAGNYLTNIIPIFCTAMTNLDLGSAATSVPEIVGQLTTWIQAALQHQQRVIQAMTFIQAAAIDSEVLDAFETVTKIWNDHAQLSTMTLVMTQTKLMAQLGDDGRGLTGFVHAIGGLMAEAGLERSSTECVVGSLALLARRIGLWQEDTEGLSGEQT